VIAGNYNNGEEMNTKENYLLKLWQSLTEEQKNILLGKLNNNKTTNNCFLIDFKNN